MEIEIIRTIDNLGRIVIPKDVRKSLSLIAGDSVKIKIENGAIIITKREVEDNG